MSAITDLSIQQLRHIANLKEKIQSLEDELDGIVSGRRSRLDRAGRAKRPYRIGAAARNRIAAAQRARWAKYRKSTVKPRRKFSAAARAKIAAAARARWAKAKASGKNKL